MMRILTYVPKDRKMTQAEWKEVDRYLRRVGKIVLPIVLEATEDLMIYGRFERYL